MSDSISVAKALLSLSKPEATHAIKLFETFTLKEEESQKNVSVPVQGKKVKAKAKVKRGPRSCKVCGEKGHDKRTCPKGKAVQAVAA